MYEIYNLDYQQASNLLSPPSKRQPVWLAFLNACLSPIQWLHDLVFTDYANGSAAPIYVSSNTYNVGDRVQYTDFAVYELINALPTVTTGIDISPVNNAYWYKALDNFIGLRERIRYNSQQLVLEYALNHFFGTNFVQPGSWGAYTYPDSLVVASDYLAKSDIYIERLFVDTDGFMIGSSEEQSSDINATDTAYFNNCIATSYTLGSQYNFIIYIPQSLATSLGSSYAGTVQSFADQYVVYGMIYKVIPYS